MSALITMIHADEVLIISAYLCIYYLEYFISEISRNEYLLLYILDKKQHAKDEINFTLKILSYNI